MEGVKVTFRTKNDIGKEKVLSMARPGITDEARCAEESTDGLAVSTEVVCLENVVDDFRRKRSNRSHGKGRGRTQCSSLLFIPLDSIETDECSQSKSNRSGGDIPRLTQPIPQLPRISTCWTRPATILNTPQVFGECYHFASFGCVVYHTINVGSMFLFATRSQICPCDPSSSITNATITT